MKDIDINDQKIEDIMSLNLGVFILESERNYELNYISKCEGDESKFQIFETKRLNSIKLGANFGKNFKTKNWPESELISTFMNDPFIRYKEKLKDNILIRNKNNEFVVFSSWENHLELPKKTKEIYSFDKHFLV